MTILQCNSTLRIFARTTCMAAAAISLIGCGATFQYGAPWNPTEARIFDDGMDILQSPEDLSGNYEDDAREEIETRMGLADMVAVVRVGAVQTNRDINGVEEKRISVTVKSEIYGMAPSETMTFISMGDALGYTLVSRHESELIGEYIAFVRWFKNPDDTTGHHFHLSPASETMILITTDLATKRREAEKASLSAK